jgi:hypothetical protein
MSTRGLARLHILGEPIVYAWQQWAIYAIWCRCGCPELVID